MAGGVPADGAASALADVIARLRAAGVRLWTEGGELRFRAPNGAVTPELLAELRARKAELVAILADARAEGETPPTRIPRAARGDAMPASLAQRRLWFLYHLDPTGSAYNVPHAVRLNGRLDRRALEHAVQDVVGRHESLRTAFESRRGEPVQIVHDRVAADTTFHDVATAADPDAAARTLAAAEATRRFDLTKAPLLRCTLIRLADDAHVIVFVLHHTIADGRSLEVLFEDLAEAYAARCAGRAPAFPPAAIQFADYAAFEREWLQSEAVHQHVQQWTSQLADAPRLLTLPTDRPRGTRPSFEGRVERLVIFPALTRALRDLSAQQGATLYMALVTALAATLGRYSGQDEVMIGSPVENRTFPETASVIGAFINTVVLRLSADANRSFAELLAGMRETAIQAYERQDVPFERLVETLQPDRDVAASPLFQVAVSWLNARKALLRLPNLQTTPYEFDHAAVKFDVNLEVYETGEDLRIAWFYSAALFDAPTMRSILGTFQRLLAAAAAAPDTPLRQLDVLDTEDRERMRQWHDGPRKPESTHPSRHTLAQFERQAARTPDVPAAIDGERIVTYAALDALATSIAAALHGRGVCSGDVVALQMEPGIELVAACLGVWKAGAGYLPIDPRTPDARRDFILTDSAARLLLSSADVAAMPPTSTYTPTAPEPSAAAYVIYTSGSTGTPKGVVVEHGSLANYLAWARETYAGDGAISMPLFTSAAFDLTVTSLFLPLLTGGCVVAYRERDRIPAVFDVFRSRAVDVVKLTPAHLAMIDHLDLAGGRIRTLIVGGEDLRTDVCRRVLDAAGGALDIYNEYGPTEATVGCTVHRFDPATDRAPSVPIGRPIANARVYVLDAHQQLLPPGAVGELCIGGAGVARGYLQRPDLTVSRFVPDPFHRDGRVYRSGDLARWRADGTLEYLGRADDQVKIRGHRIELDEVARAIAADTRVGDCVVVARERPRRSSSADVRHCTRCGLASNYPGTSLDGDGVCTTCHEFAQHRAKVQAYFQTPAELRAILDRARERRRGAYDCVALVSGGKDSVYMLARLKEMGAQILAYTLDPGFLSEEAIDNIRRVTTGLGVDHVFGGTPHMNEIFVDSLRRHANVCNGCFKTLYTLSITLAHERGIPLVFTGLSRGQMFETRLSKHYAAPGFDAALLDRAILEARKVYHRLEDTVAQRLDTRAFKDDHIFDEVAIVDFYRYVDVGLGEMLTYLREQVGWRRPSDTGRSTNCLINDVGIFVHARERGYHNYALPYSWDVRMGHKRREEALDELNDDIDEARVRRILAQIGWKERERPAAASDTTLVAYYVAKAPVTGTELREGLARRLPEPMLPSHFVEVERMPLTPHGKVDRRALPPPQEAEQARDVGPLPSTPLERRIAAVWSAVLGVDTIGIHQNFFALGGHSLMATRVAAQLAEDIGIDVPLAILFEKPTIVELAAAVEPSHAAAAQTIEAILADVEGMTLDEARAHLQR